MYMYRHTHAHTHAHVCTTYIHKACHLCVCHVNHHVCDVLKVDVEQLCLKVEYKQGEDVAISQQRQLLLQLKRDKHKNKKQTNKK